MLIPDQKKGTLWPRPRLEAEGPPGVLPGGLRLTAPVLLASHKDL